MSTEQKMSMSFSQAVMRQAIEYYLRNVLLKSSVVVKKVETTDSATGMNSVQHFMVDLALPDDATQ
jgi:hypothetical protein